MTNQPLGLNEADFLTAVGIDPNEVLANTLRVEMKSDGVILHFGALRVIDYDTYGRALSASVSERTPPEPAKAPARKAAAKAPAKKATAKKAAAKK